MEFLKGFQFQIQMFAGYAATTITLTSDSSSPALPTQDGGTGNITLQNSGGATVGTLSYAASTYTLTLTTTALTDQYINLGTLVSGLASGESIEVVDSSIGVATGVRFMVGSDVFGVSTAVTAGTSTPITISYGGDILPVQPLTVYSGDVTLASTTTAVNQATKLNSASTSVTFTGTNAGTVTLGAYGNDTVSVTNGAAGAVKVAGTGNVSALKAGGAVTYTDAGGDGTLGAGGLTVQTADTSGTFTINTTDHTISAANTSNVTFTVSETVGAGVTKVSALTSGATDTYAAKANVAVTIGNSIVETLTNTTSVVATSNGTGVSDVTKASATFVGIGMSGRTGYTINGNSVTVGNDTTNGVDVVTAASTTGLASIAGLSKNASLDVQNADKSAYVEQVAVTTDTGLVAGTDSSGSSYVTVNNVKYYAGRSAVNVTTTQLTINTTASGSLLTTGTVYLDGSSSSSIYIGDNTAAGTATTGRVKLNVLKGDMSVTANGGAYTVHDLDNGDSFTVEAGTDTYTYQVVNGVLYRTNPSGVSTAVTGATLTSGNEGTYSLNLAFNKGTVNVTTGAAREDNVYTTPGDDIGETLTINLAVNNKSAVTTFVKGSTNYISSSNIISTSSTDAVGSMTYDDSAEVFTYTASANKQKIDISGDGNNKWVINGTSGNDTIVGNALASTLNGGSGNDTITAGANNVVFGGDGNDSMIGAADASLSGGSGVDTLYSAAATTTLTGGDGADVFVLSDGAGHTAGTGVITDYSFSDDVLLVGASTNMASVTSANVSSDGTAFTFGTTVTVNGSNGNYQVMLQNTSKKKQAVGWTSEDGNSVDFSAQTSGTVIIGNKNTTGDSLYGGSGADTIYGGNADTIYGGAGADTINLTAGENAKTVGFGVTSGTSKDTVTGFANGFDTETKDNLYLVGDASSLAVTLAGSTLNLKMGNAKMEMQNLTVGTNKVAEVLFGDAKAAFIASGNTGVISEADYANYYWGTKDGTIKSGLDFSALDSDVEVNLSDTTTYRNISSLTGGTGNTTLMGSSEKETLVSGGGNTSLWGGAGNDVLQGKSGAKDVFFLLNGSGKDTVTSFEAYTESTSDTADVLYVSDLTSAKAVSGAVELATSDGSKFTLSGLNNNSEIQYTTDGTNIAIAKLGSVSAANSFTYASEVNFYGGGSKVDSLTVSGSDNAAIWLDNSKGGNVTFSSIEVVNGQSAQGDLLIAGNESVNTLIAGRGDASLWGGSGNTKDYLKGSTNGTTQFFYGYGEGNDTIVSSNADDVVNLLNITLANINGAATEITSSGVTLGMNDGSKLTVQTTKDITFSLADGSKYTANHNDKSWS